MSEIIGNDDDLPSTGVLRSQHGQSPGNHTNLKCGWEVDAWREICVYG